MVQVRIENRRCMQIPGNHAWELAKPVIRNSFRKKSIFEKRFRLDISNTNHCYGASFVLFSASELENKLDYITANHARDGFFEVSFYNIDLYEKNIKSETVYFEKSSKKIKKGAYELVA